MDHEKLLTLVAQRIADGRVLRLIRAMLKAGSYGKGRLFPSERGTPQGGVVSPLLSNILLTPFDREMRRKGYQLTRYADDWVVTCKSAAEARAAMAAALRILSELGVQLHPQKTRIVHVQHGFEFLGYKIKRGKQLQLPAEQDPQRCPVGGAVRVPEGEIDPAVHGSGAAAYQAKRAADDRGADRADLIPLLRGWGHYYKRPTSERSSTDSTAGSCGASGRIGSSVGATAAGNSCRRRKLYGEYGLVQPGRIDSFDCISEAARLRESCMRENRTCSLSGGRRPARKRASSDPTWIAERREMNEMKPIDKAISKGR